MKLPDIDGIKKLEFDLQKLILTIYHYDDVDLIDNSIKELNLNEGLIRSGNTTIIISESIKNEAKLLWTVLIINFAFFVIEMSTGILSESMGIVADSLGMLQILLSKV